MQPKPRIACPAPLLVVLLVSGVLARPASGQTLHYRAFDPATDSTLWLFRVTVPAVEQGVADVIWESESGDGHREDYRIDATGDTQSWLVYFPERETHYGGVREGTRVRVAGRIDGDSIEGEYGLDDQPLYVNVALGLGAFVRSGGEEIDFWTFRPSDRSVIRMKAQRESIDTLWVEGRETPVVRVHWRPTGWRRFFFGRRFWLRADDGVLVETDEAEGRVTALVGVG